VRREPYRTHFHLHLPDTHANAGMVEALESLYGAEECRFRTIYGPLDGYRVRASRDVAEKIEVQSRFSAALYDVDLRGEQRFMAEKGLFPCGNEGEDRLSEEFESPLTCIGIEVEGNPQIDSEVRSVSLAGGCSGKIEGDERVVLSDLLSTIESFDPDLILFPNADFWMHIIARKAGELGLDQSFSRDGSYSKLDSRSYWSYGKVNYRAGALIPHGRILIDTEKSFTYEAGGLNGVLLASRLTGMSPNLTSRLTPGTLVSGYEAYEAIRRGISIPFRKSDPERLRKLTELKAADRGGMIFQPAPGISGKSCQIDFTSLYPSIIVKFNLSPESLDSGGSGFLSEALAPLLELRIRTKRLKKTEQGYAGLDSVLKWMLVTCFGYTGYRNAKFGSIEVHERITSIARDILVRTKDIAEEMGFEVLHGIVDCLWVRGGAIWELKARVEGEIGIPTEVEEYDWLVFLDMVDGFGAYNRYYGRLSDGGIKSRGVMANRRDCPEYVKRMQLEMLEAMAAARNVGELDSVEPSVREIHDRYAAGLRGADAKEMVVNHRIGKLDYDKDCLQKSALGAYARLGVELEPGMTVGYVVRDARRRIVDAEWDAHGFDAGYYGRILEKASAEVTFAFESARRLSKRGGGDATQKGGRLLLGDRLR
jgi:DNA polymerase I